jgi:ADP-ribosyl-[dinitrogen reductase] hydrolase
MPSFILSAKVINKTDRYRGALVGVLAGDAFLAPYETWSSHAVKMDLDKRGGLVPFDYTDPWNRNGVFPMGRPTDDSDHTAALAESLIVNRDINEEDLFNRLRNVTFGYVSPLWEGKAVGAGKTTRDALRPLTYQESQARSTEGAFPSNGSLMRSAPLALYFGTFENFDNSVVTRMSRVTHVHKLAIDCCLAYVATLVNLLEGHDAQYSIKSHLGYSLADGICVNAAEIPRDPEQWPGSGAADLTLHIALWALINAADFRDGLTKVALIGGDTDTYGAVAGGLLGAKFGLEGIPSEWRQVLKGQGKMIEYADALYAIAHPPHD